MGLCLSATLLSSVQAFAVAGHNKPISSGRLKYYYLNKSGSYSANAVTEFVPSSGHKNLRGYVFLEAVSRGGSRLNSTEALGGRGGTVSNPSVASTGLSHPNAYSWGSTHRSERISDYEALYLKN